jgi:hypothetical protein
MVPLHVCGIQCKGRQAFWGRTCHHGSGRDRPMTILLIPARAERVPLASGGTAGRSPKAINWRILARSSPWFIREEQQEGGHGPPRNTDARLDRATVRPGPELAGLSTLQHDRLVCGTLPSAANPTLRASAIPIPGARWPTCAPKLIDTYLAVPITGTIGTHSPSSGTRINSWPCPHQFTKRGH